jgi:hypothetical protein
LRLLLLLLRSLAVLLLRMYATIASHDVRLLHCNMKHLLQHTSENR